jgi:type I restriction enzyme, S subunit
VIPTENFVTRSHLWRNPSYVSQSPQIARWPWFYALPVSIPEPQTQQHIARILSEYDDLIENNRRRMALLDESARLLYQEWFVRLRFPGHEHTPLINGVPKGWERRALGDCLTLKRGHDLPEANRLPGTIPIVSSSGITGFHNVKKANGPGLVTGRYGTLGEVYYIDEDYWPHNTALYVCDFKDNSARVLYFFLKHALQNAQSNNAAVPGLNRNVLHTLRVLWPPKQSRDDFDDFLEPLFRQLASLRQFNEKLITARDLLLPRLMSGEVVA